jgi:small-conductance mechanosensitive channel
MALPFDQALYLMLVAAVGVAAAVLAWGIARIGLAMAARTEGTLDDKFAKALHLPLAAFSGVIAGALTMVLLQGRIADGYVLQSRRVFLGIVLVLGIWGLIRVVRALLERTGERHARFLPAARVGSRLLALFLYTIAFLMVLSIYGISITPILTGLGIAGLAVALALQDTGANFFAGIWIQTGRAMQPGHYVKLESEKLEGYVEEVGWRVTSIRTLGGNVIVVPNNKLAQSITTDYYLPDPSFSVSQSFRVGFEADPEQVIKILVEEGQAVTKALPGIVPGEPFGQLAEIANDCNVYSVTVRVKEFVEQYAAQRELRMRILRRFQQEGIRMPYPAQHVLQEQVEAPKAKRKPSGPGGFAPGRRPPRPAKKAAAHDPMADEAARAKQEIEAKQQQKAEAADGAKAGKEEAGQAEAPGTKPEAAAATAGERAADGDGRPQSGEPKDAKESLKPAR